MGTSASYGSPKWPGVNTSIGDAVSSGHPSSGEVKNAVAAFASAYKSYLNSGSDPSGSGGRGVGATSGSSGGGGRGGSGGAARERSAGLGAQLGHFLSTAHRSGFGEALRRFDLSDLKDKPLEEFLDAVVGRLTGDGGLLDDGSLNEALARTLDELSEDIASVEEFEELLESGNIDIEETLQIYYANILIINFEQKEFSVVRDKIAREETKEFFERAGDIIRAIVRDELSRERDLTSLDWNSPEGLRIADSINQEVLDILCPDE